MKIFLTAIITFILTSLIWLNLIMLFPQYVPIPKLSEAEQYEQIKKEKEMEMKAEIELMLGKDGLEEFENMFK